MYPSHRPSRLTHVLLLIAGLGLLTAGTASAGFPSPFELHREIRDHVSDVLRVLSRVPDHIESAHQRHLEAFFGGREYYGPHRHYHDNYQFPVWIDGDVQYRPYSYCGGQLFGTVSVRPYLWLDWSHESDGFWCDHCHGYFPRQHGHFQRRDYRPRPQYYRPHYQRHDSRDRYQQPRRNHRYERRDNDRRGNEHRGSNQRHRGRNDRYDRDDDHRGNDHRDRGRGSRRGNGHHRRGHHGGD